MKEYDWLQPTLERISDLLKMPDVHNSYGTPKVDPSFTLKILRRIVGTEARMLPVPEILPAGNGGLRFLWRGLEMECSLLLSPPFVHVSSRKGDLVLDSGELASWEEQLSEALCDISKELMLSEPKP